MKGRVPLYAFGLFFLSAGASDVDGQSRVFAVDSSVSVSLPHTFIPAPLNDRAILQFADTVSEAYVLVVMDSKEDLIGWNLTRHSIVTVAQMVASLDMPDVTGPKTVQIGPNAAVQYEVRGAMQGTRIAYLHTSVESPHAFAQVLAWTTGSKWRAVEQAIRDVTSSIELHAPPETVPYDIRQLAQRTWAWERGPESCNAATQRFEIAADGMSMKIHHSEPIESVDGTTTSVTNYVVEGGDSQVLHTYIPGETRVDDSGQPVKWNLVLVARNRIAWQRADWPEGSLTGMLKPCPAR